MSTWSERLRHAVHHPSYVVRRLALWAYEKTHPGEPWIASGAVRFCERELHRGMVALEWGSGRSTLWFANRVGRLTSVEHDHEWYNRMAKQVGDCKNVEYRWVPLDHDPKEPTHLNYATLPRYVAVANEFEDESLDFVVVDGHYRQSCVQAVLGKLRRGGLLLIDNWNRLPRSEWPAPATYAMRHQSSNAMTETAILQKP